MGDYQIGDLVKVVGKGKTYCRYNEWAEEHITPPRRWVKDELPEKDGIYTITKIAPHKAEKHLLIYALSDDEGQTFMMDKEGFQIVEQQSSLRSLIEELDMYLDFDEPLAPGEAIRVRDTEKVNILFRKLKEAIK